MPRITALVSRKGGVSKTTSCMNLAAVTHEALGGDPDRSSVLVVSTDPQNSSEWWADRIKNMPFDHVSVKDPGELVKLAGVPHRQVLVDTPGSLDGPILRAVLEVVDDVLVPLPPEAMAFDATGRTIEQVLIPRQVPYHVFVSDWDGRTRSSRTLEGQDEEAQTQAYVKARGWCLATSSIRSYKVIARLPLDGSVITQYPESNRAATQAKNDYLRLALEVGLGHPLDTVLAKGDA